MTKQLFRLLPLFALLTVATFTQNKFEGYNLVLQAPKDHRHATCAVRYVNPSTAVTVTDLNRATATNIKPCAGSTAKIVQNLANGATLNASAADYKWCFMGEDKRYRVTFPGDQYSGPITYDWIAEMAPREDGFYNIRDFGAVGDGKTDDTIAIRSALAYVASKNGGVIRFPIGEYLVTSALALPSGVTIEGTNGLHSGATTGNIIRQSSTRITLDGANRSLFQIGECVEKVTVKNIELYAKSNDGTSGIEAFGAYTSSQDIVIDQVVFNNFNRGINAYGLPQTDLNWQFDYIKVNNSRFIFNRDTGIFVNIRNSDWKISGGLFINPAFRPGQNANSMHFERSAAVFIQDTFGGGFAGAIGGTFINILDGGNVTILQSQTEEMTNSLVYNAVKNPGAGDYSYPITMINSIFANPIVFNARRTFVSTGNLYGSNAFKADERLRVYSTGDRFCYDGYILGCADGPKNNFDKATIVFMTGQPSEGRVTGHQAIIGSDLRIDGNLQLQTVQQNALPPGRSNGSIVYCQNCRRSTTPCQAGGSGSPAVMVNGQWSCL